MRPLFKHETETAFFKLRPETRAGSSVSETCTENNARTLFSVSAVKCQPSYMNTWTKLEKINVSVCFWQRLKTRLEYVNSTRQPEPVFWH